MLRCASAAGCPPPTLGAALCPRSASTAHPSTGQLAFNARPTATLAAPSTALRASTHTCGIRPSISAGAGQHQRSRDTAGGPRRAAVALTQQCHRHQHVGAREQTSCGDEARREQHQHEDACGCRFASARRLSSIGVQGEEHNCGAHSRGPHCLQW